jgi:hypothetical protein
MTRLLMTLALFLAAPALADVPPPNTTDCATKAAGAACKKDDGAAGTCLKATCSRLDYSGGTPPQSVSYECVTCGDAPKSGCAAVPGLGLLSLGVWLAKRRHW